MIKVAMTGAAGTKKSTVARELAKAFDLVLVEEEAHYRLAHGLEMDNYAIAVRQLQREWAGMLQANMEDKRGFVSECSVRMAFVYSWILSAAEDIDEYCSIFDLLINFGYYDGWYDVELHCMMDGSKLEDNGVRYVGKKAERVRKSIQRCRLSWDKPLYGTPEQKVTQAIGAVAGVLYGK
ncbi:MAG: hypothetical protein SVY53_05170 [Chloroflexota bacterium]|nr:hypothetical protein [Chloroflexota bacterium]